MVKTLSHKIIWDDDWIIEHHKHDKSIKRLCEAYNKDHNMDMNINTFGWHVHYSLGLGEKYRPLTEDENAFFLENYCDKSNNEFLDAFEKRFGWRPNRKKLNMKAHNLGMHKTKETKRKSNLETIDALKRPVGSERKDYDGFYKVKVGVDESGKPIWKRKHIVIWEEANGPIPEGYVIMFKDGDRSNLDLDNLVCVPRSFPGYFATFGKRDPATPELNEVKFKYCEFQEELKKKEKEDG